MVKIFLIVGLLLASIPGATQTLYKCADGKGGNVYQQTACASAAATKKVVQYKRAADAPHDYGQYQRQEPDRRQTEAQPNSVQQQYRSQQYQRRPDPGEGVAQGYVKCTRPSGGTYIAKGRCHATATTNVVQPQPGMVMDVQTGRQHFMVPTGGPGLLDPATGRRYERMGGPPTVTTRREDSGQTVSRAEVCAQARAKLTASNRSIDSIRAAEKRVAEVCD